MTTRGAGRGLPAPRVTFGSRQRQGRTERGAVTAEMAVVLPVLVGCVIALVWVVSLAATQVRVVDAARETARAAARGDANPTALGRRVAPDGARIRLDPQGGTVTVDVAADVDGPGGLLGFLPGLTLRGHAVAAVESP